MDQQLEYDRFSLSSCVTIPLKSFFTSFLPYSSLSTTEEMMNIGLTLHDLNFYDGSSEILIAGMQHARQLQAAIDKVNIHHSNIPRLIHQL